MNRRLVTGLSIVLAALLVLALMPLIALAEESDPQGMGTFGAPLGDTYEEAGELPEGAASGYSVTITGVNPNLIPGLHPAFTEKVTSPSNASVLQAAWNASNNESGMYINGPDSSGNFSESGTATGGITYHYEIAVRVPRETPVTVSQTIKVIIDGKAYTGYASTVCTTETSFYDKSGSPVYYIYLIVSDYTVKAQAPVPLYRMYNTKTSEHLWTRNKAEYDKCGSGNYADWKAEGVAWYVPNKSSKPVYRLYNTKSGDHHYTTSAAERDKLVSSGQWRDEGVAFYSATKKDAKTIKIYRVYNSRLKRGQHHYTKSATERDSLVKSGSWKDEGVGFYGYSNAKPA